MRMTRTTDQPDAALSIISLVNDESQYAEMRATLVLPGVQWIPIDADANGWNAATALNAGLEAATADWVLCAHQDVRFPDGWWTRVRHQLESLGHDVAVAGLMGMTRQGAFRGAVHDPNGPCRWGPLPAEVLTIDEHAIFLRAEHMLRFDPEVPGFHGYGADIALQARSRGLAVRAIEAPVVHLSSGHLDGAFEASARWLLGRWGATCGLCIPTCAATIAGRGVGAVVRRAATSVYRRAGRVRRQRAVARAVAPPVVTPRRRGLRPVLLLSHYFPPHGGAGTQRFARFARWLPRFGYRPIVVSGDAHLRLANAPTADESLVHDIGTEAVVHRVGADDRVRLPWTTRLATSLNCHADAEKWSALAEPVAAAAIMRYGCEAIVTTVSPYAVAGLGRSLRDRFGLPWILDLRDPWAIDPWRVHPTQAESIIDRRRMRQALRDADLTIASTPSARSAFVDMAGIAGERVWTIPNGYEPSAFDGPAPEHNDGLFHLVHSGTLHSPFAEDHRPPLVRAWNPARNVDFTGRSGRYLFEAIAGLRAARPDLIERLRVELIGQVHPGHAELAESLGIADLVVERGYVEHGEAIRHLRGADMAFVPLHGFDDDRDARIVPAKLYEALASEAFVLACVPPGDAATLTLLTGAGTVCNPCDAEAIAAAIAARMESTAPARCIAPATNIEAFSREALTARLADAIDVARGRHIVAQPDDPWSATAALGWSAGAETLQDVRRAA